MARGDHPFRLDRDHIADLLGDDAKQPRARAGRSVLARTAIDQDDPRAQEAPARRRAEEKPRSITGTTTPR